MEPDEKEDICKAICYLLLLTFTLWASNPEAPSPQSLQQSIPIWGTPWFSAALHSYIAPAFDR